MYLLRLSGLFFLLTLTHLSFSQRSMYIYDIDEDDNLFVDINSNNGYKSIELTLENKTNQELTLKIPCGTFFETDKPNEQNLVVLFEETIYFDRNNRKSIRLITACMDADKASPSSHTNWEIKNDPALGNLISFYHANKSLVSMMTGPKYHETEKQQTEFLQMSVWAYFDAERKHILNFATKYMFDGNREDATIFVDTTLPIIQLFTNYYKMVNK